MGFALSRLPQTDDELFWTVRAMFGVTIPRHTSGHPDCIRHGHVAPFTAFADAYFRRNSVGEPDDPKTMALWHGSRGLSGKSFMLSILGLALAHLRGSDVNLLGGSLAQSTNIHNHMRSAMEYPNAPRFSVVEDTNTKISLGNQSVIRPLTASQRTVRGPHPQTLLLDEIDEMDIQILYASLGQAMEQDTYVNERLKPYTVMCSTWQNPEGTFTTIKRMAEERNWPQYTWCFRDTANPIDGWLTEEAINDKKNSIPENMWRVEYELGEPSIGNRAFDADAVDAMFSLEVDPITEEHKDYYDAYRFEEYDRDGVYVAGADWAKEQDWTVMVVARVDCDPYRVVRYVQLNRRPWPVMINLYNEMINEYNAYPIHDATGIGNVVQDLLDERARPFIMAGEKRATMLTEYVSAVERGHWRAPVALKKAYLATKFCRVDDLYRQSVKAVDGSVKFHLPDEVCAMALCNFQAKRFAPLVPALLNPKNKAQTKYEKIFDNPANAPHDEPRLEGEVQQLTYGEDTNRYSFAV